MKSSKKNKGAPKSESKKRLAHEAEGAASVALVGALVGAAAGPPGMVAGAIVGGAAGALTGEALDAESSRRSEHERALDEQIGVFGGDLGAPNLEHRPATVGAYSAASAGAAPASGEEPAEGPMQTPES